MNEERKNTLEELTDDEFDKLLCKAFKRYDQNKEYEKYSKDIEDAEKAGGSFLPYPEVDTAFERIRSRLVILLDRIISRLKKIKP